MTSFNNIVSREEVKFLKKRPNDKKSLHERNPVDSKVNCACLEIHTESMSASIRQ